MQHEMLLQVVFPTQLGPKEREQLSKILPGPGSTLSSNGRMDTDDTETVCPAFRVWGLVLGAQGGRQLDGMQRARWAQAGRNHRV